MISLSSGVGTGLLRSFKTSSVYDEYIQMNK